MQTTAIPKIRKMRRADAEAVAEMMTALAAYHGDVTKIGAGDSLTRGIGSKKLATIWIATVGREPAGFAAAYDWMNFVRALPVLHIAGKASGMKISMQRPRRSAISFVTNDRRFRSNQGVRVVQIAEL